MVEPSRLTDDDDTEGHVGSFIVDANQIEADDDATTPRIRD
jgi:hypothetical protein